MTINEILELRRLGQIEEAYEAIRMLYARDKGPTTSTAMFWIAVDILKARAGEGRIDEAHKIMQALERMLPAIPDKDGCAQNVLAKCRQTLGKTEERERIEKEPEHLKTGIWGEDLAVVYLREKGYVILDRNWHSGHRDIDIIARNSEYYVFVEVKTRQNTVFADPVMAVDYKKRKNLQQAINHYIRYRNIVTPIRFDIITIVGKPDSLNPIINHYEDVQIMELSHRR